MIVNRADFSDMPDEPWGMQHVPQSVLLAESCDVSIAAHQESVQRFVSQEQFGGMSREAECQSTESVFDWQ